MYGAGRLGLFKPQFNLTFYELQDHLGNVRAVIGAPLAVSYLATMESERSAKEEAEFGPVRRSATAPYINHTPAQVTVDGQTETIGTPNEVLRINNGMDSPKSPVGLGKMLQVHPGDQIRAGVFAKYAHFNQNNQARITGLAGYLATAFGGATTVVEGVNIFAGLEQGTSPVFAAWNRLNEQQPRAFLSYILYDRNFNPILFDQVQVSEAARIPGSGNVLAETGAGCPEGRLPLRLPLQPERAAHGCVLR